MSREELVRRAKEHVDRLEADVFVSPPLGGERAALIELIRDLAAALGDDALPETGNDLLLSDAIYLEGLALVRTGAEASRLTAIAYRIRSALVASPKNLKEPRRD